MVYERQNFIFGEMIMDKVKSLQYLDQCLSQLKHMTKEAILSRDLLIEVSMDKPVPRAVIPFENIVKVVKEYVDFLDSDDYHDDKLHDFKHYIFEASMEAVYGEEVWNYINRHEK
jgi:CRISPR/Cas system CSM-associated protein Csm2 small subunit